MNTNSARFLGLTACVTLLSTGCGPSIDQASKRDIDQRLAALSTGAERYAKPAGFAPKPIAVGQWVEYRMIDDEGKPSFMKQMITGQEGDAFWYEVVSQTYTGRTATRMLMSFGDRMNPDTFEIKAMRMKDKDGQVTDYPESMLGLLRSSWKGMLQGLVIRWEGLPQEDASVPAGTFEGCFKGRSEASWGPYSVTSTAWSHADVPISGTVKSVGEDKKFNLDLVGFGETGAQSAF